MDIHSEIKVEGEVSLPVALKSRTKNRRQRIEALWGFFFLLPQLVGLLAFALIPLISVFALSLVKWDGLGDMQFTGFSNFQEQLTDIDFHTALLNTAFYTALVVPGGLLLALLAALGLNRVRGKTIYRVVYFMPVITSSVAVSVIWLWLLNGDYGLINSLLRQWFGIQGPQWLTNSRLVIPSISLVSIWWGLGFNIVIFLAGLQGIPATYLEAARIDGAGSFQVFGRITLPLLSPTLFFVMVISIINSFQVFDQTYIMTAGGPGKASYTLVYHIYNLAFQKFTFGSASTVAVILFMLLLVFTLCQFAIQRYWVYYES
jgi:multiple sugar transport system permease protein